MRHLVAPERVLLSLVMVVLVLMSLLFGFLFWFALPVVTDPSIAVFSLQWQPDQGHYGILPMVFGSGVLAIAASLVAFPFALGIASSCQYSRYQPIAIWIRRLVRRLFSALLSHNAILMTSTILTNNPFLVSMDESYFDPVTFSAFTYSGACDVKSYEALFTA
ncbi:hypothetical protein VTH8203_04427 [Vibrio thalassae]|uniref:Uncharacterized protein n=1 Tax=Vibrio thalassae TaxID=1243014 RepID=A0A240ER03_9VIBR|nr:hypothetical protein [Vibrio thalassae]SNX50753.1 hypothetical protein VTH8203_04427 [Vibrio thalassae]